MSDDLNAELRAAAGRNSSIPRRGAAAGASPAVSTGGAARPSAGADTGLGPRGVPATGRSGRSATDLIRDAAKQSKATGGAVDLDEFEHQQDPWRP